jgi:hypothetical protein
MGTDGETVRRDLGDGLILRRATAEDTDALVAFNAALFGQPEDSNDDADDWRWTIDAKRPRVADSDTGGT